VSSLRLTRNEICFIKNIVLLFTSYIWGNLLPGKVLVVRPSKEGQQTQFEVCMSSNGDWEIGIFVKNCWLSWSRLIVCREFPLISSNLVLFESFLLFVQGYNFVKMNGFSFVYYRVYAYLMGLCIRQGSGGVCPSGRPANPI
jgi:hypothetical protein